MKKLFQNKGSIVLKGMAMGAADVVPGVSGGTVAFITGIYETLINTLASFRPKHIVALLQILKGGESRKQGVATILEINWGFLIPLGLGIVVSILTLSKIIVRLMDTFPMETYAFFFGLILFSTKFPFQEMPKTVWNYVIIALSAIFAFAFFSLGEFQGLNAENPFMVFVAGSIAVCALILPGISGSTFLVIMGMYRPILAAVHNRDIFTIGIFVTGMAVGILSFIRVLKWLLSNYHGATMAALTGLMLGSLKKVWPLQYSAAEVSISISSLAPLVLFVVMGVIVVFAIEKSARRQEHSSAT